MLTINCCGHRSPTSALVIVAFGCVLGCASINLEPSARAEDEPAAAISEEPVAAMETTAPVQETVQDPEAEADTDATPEKVAPVVEEQADIVLRQMAEYLGTARAYTFHAEITTEDVILSNIKIQTTASLDIGLRRPNGLYAEYAGDISQRRLWFDGEHFTLLDGVHNVYGELEVPTSLEKTLKELRDKYDSRIPMSFLVINNAYTEIIEKVKFGFYIGLRNVQGTRCHHLAFVTDDVHFQIWVEDGAQFVPRKLVVTYRNEPEAPQYTAFISDWDFAPRLSKYLFVPKIPADAVKIDFLEIRELPTGEVND